MRNKKIGWIGTGLMGLPMAGHLINAGYNLGVFSRTRSKAETLLSVGGQWHESPAALALHADVVVTMVGLPAEVEACYFGEQGILHTAKPGTILIDMTTTKPSLARKISEAAYAKGVAFIDAPVSGGQVGAVQGTLSIMAGGDKEIVDRVLPLFKVFGKNIVYQGPAGSGQHTKMSNQIVIAGTLVGVCEGLLYGFKAGLDLDTLLQSISRGAAECWSLNILAPKIVKGDLSPGFSVDNFVKDLGIALEEAAHMKLSLPGLALARQLYTGVQAMGHGSSGNQALILALEKLSAVTLAGRPEKVVL